MMIIDILLATYNGEKYLREQLDSLVGQTNQDWRIIARDDGSNDATVSILKEYQEKLGKDKLIILPPAERNPEDNIPAWKRIIHNFSALAEWSKNDGNAEYVMFSDQDDIWHADKIERSLTEQHKLEEKYGKDSPLLVNTDARMITADGLEKYRSYVKYLHFHPEKEKGLYHLTVNV